MNLKFLFLSSFFLIFDTFLLAQVCSEPLLHRNQIPPAAIFLELVPASPCILPAGKFSFKSNTQKSNTAIITGSETSSIPRFVIDHERVEQSFDLQAGIGWQSSLGIILRYIEDSTGNWDGFMRDFHAKLNLPYAAREVRKDNTYLYWQYNPEEEKWITN